MSIESVTEAVQVADAIHIEHIQPAATAALEAGRIVAAAEENPLVEKVHETLASLLDLMVEQARRAADASTEVFTKAATAQYKYTNTVGASFPPAVSSGALVSPGLDMHQAAEAINQESAIVEAAVGAVLREGMERIARLGAGVVAAATKAHATSNAAVEVSQAYVARLTEA